MKRKAFWDHLEDLRWTILKIGGTLLVGCFVLFYFSPQLLKVITWPLQTVASHGAPVALRTLRPTSSFMIGLKLSFEFSLIVFFPLLAFFLAQFLAPALKPRERRWIVPVLLTAAGLFAVGALFCYFVALPMALRYFWGFGERMGLANEWTIEYYVSFATGFILAFGVVFETPILVLGLVRASILTPEFLRQKRSYAIVGILVLAAILAPPDVLSLILLAIPMLVLYEACVWSAKWFRVKDQTS